MKTQEFVTIVTLNEMIGSVADRDLGVLRKIDITLDALQTSKAQLHLYEGMVLRQIEDVQKINRPIDVNGSLVELLEKTREAFGRAHSRLEKKCDCARNAPELHEDDGVVEAYCELIEANARMHNAINELCWTIGEHDADFDEVAPGGPYSSVEEMLAALKA